MSIMTVGSYVNYKLKPYILCEVRNNSMAVLVSPDNKKVVVGLSKVLPTNFAPCVVVRHAQADYLVSKLGMIISLKTCKIMQWDTKHGNRLAIIKLAKEQW